MVNDGLDTPFTFNMPASGQTIFTYQAHNTEFTV